MQQAKDSFFAALRDRLAAVNSSRKIVLAGQERPGILVCENETDGTETAVSDVFCLRWGAADAASSGPNAPMSIDCTLSYATAGSAEFEGMDRGRKLTAMDAEVAAILRPRTTQKSDYSSGAAVPSSSVIFWSEPSMGAPEESRRRLKRSTTVKVFYYPEVH